ncbi:hypothetical protein TPA0905_62230 [Streptomyces olivaceus]|nr:hypothetical protein TPA0905_62230 [Streptomyces olivaceus]
MSGLTPRRMRNAANGVRTRVKNARAYLFSMAFPTVGVVPRPLLATGWPIVVTRACGRGTGTLGRRWAADGRRDRVLRMDAA